MKQKKYIAILFFFVFSNFLIAGNMPPMISGLAGSNIGVSRIVTTQDLFYNFMQSSTNTWETIPLITNRFTPFNQTKVFSNTEANAYVILRWEGSDGVVFSNIWTYEIKVDVKVWNEYGQMIGQQEKNLVINYDPSHKAEFKDWDVFKIPGAYKISIEVLDIKYTDHTGTPINQTSVPANNLFDDLYLEASVEVERFFSLDLTVAPTFTNQVVNSTNKTLEAYWNYIQGAEEYDLEWLFVSGKTISPPNIDWNNATRVTLKSNSYKIELPYEDGSFYYRVRGVGFGNKAKQRLLGTWSSISTLDIDFSQNVEPLEKTKNWIYIAQYAEDGKRSDALTFFDGIGRSRQSVAKNQETDEALVAESFYDFEGREALDMTPGLSNDERLGFYENFNSVGNIPLSANHFDLATHISSPNTVPVLDATTGSAKYYSTNNPNSNNFKAAFVPKSTTVSSRKLYDAQGRMVLSSGVGDEFKWGGGHEQKTMYGSIYQEQLDALFGTDIGYADHYRMKATRDPDGQISVLYEDMSGRPIATALSGATPDVAIDIDDNYRYDISHSTIDVNLKPFNESLDFGDRKEWLISKEITAFSAGNYDIHYQFIPPADYTYSCANGSLTLNFDAEYILEIRLYDAFGNLLNFDGSSFVSNSSLPGGYTLADIDAGIQFNNNTSSSSPIDISILIDDANPNALPIGTYIIEKRLKLINLDEIKTELLTELANPANACFDFTLNNFSYPSNSCYSNVQIGDNSSPLYPDSETYCTDAYSILKQDMSPDGQYFDNLPDSDPTNINNWLNNELPAANTFVFQYTDLNSQVQTAQTWDEVRANWKDEWGDVLVTEHPEFCFLCGPGGNIGNCLCDDLNDSRDFNTYLRGLDPAIGTTTYNPTCNTSPNYAIFDLPVYPAGTGDPILSVPLLSPVVNLLRDKLCNYIEVPAGSGNYKSMWEVATDMYNGIPSNPRSTWEYFVDLYTQTKQDLIEQELSVHCVRLQDADPDPEVTQTSDGFEIRFPTQESLEDQLTQVLGSPPDQTSIINYANQQYQEHSLCGYAIASINMNCFEELDPFAQLFLELNLPNTAGVINKFGSTTIPLTPFDMRTHCSAPISPNQSGYSSLSTGIDNCFSSIPCLQQAIDNHLITNGWNQYLEVVLQTNGLGINSGIEVIVRAKDHSYWDNSTSSFIQSPDYIGGQLRHFSKNANNGIINTISTDLFEEQDCDQVLPFCLCEDLAYYRSQGYSTADIATKYITDLSLTISQSQAELVILAVENKCSTFIVNSFSDYAAFINELETNLTPTLPNEMKCWQPNPVTCEDELNTLAGLYTNLLNLAEIQNLANQALGDYIDYYMPGPTGPDNMQYAYQDQTYHYTLYYYDLAGNLIKTISPSGVIKLDPSQSTSVTANRANPINSVVPDHQLVTVYEFNSLNKVTKMYSPDRGELKLFYDELARPISMQTARQKQDGEATYIKYDAFSRPKEEGLLYETNQASNGYIDNYLGTSSNLVHTADFPESAINSGNLGKKEVRWMYFHEDPDNLNLLFREERGSLRNRLAAVKYSYSGNLSELTYGISYNYDFIGNVKEIIQSYKYFTGNTTRKSIQYKYDLITQNVNELLYQEGLKDQISYRFHYDAISRLTKTESSLNGYIWNTDTRYEFYDNGPLRRTEIGNKQVQGLDYAYTINGNIKSLNTSNLNENHDPGRDGSSISNIHSQANIHEKVARDIYGYNLFYHDNDYESLIGSSPMVANIGSVSGFYNDNIKGIVQAQTKPEIGGNPQAPIESVWKSYDYDVLGRIKSSIVKKGNVQNLRINNNWGSITTIQGFETSYSYDPNGNILNLKRHGANSAIVLDDLSYHYSSALGGTSNTTNTSSNDYFLNNRLQYITDIQGPPNAGMGDVGTQAPNNYTYDPDGNLIQDYSDDIQEITWTSAGKVKSIKRTIGSSYVEVEYLYDAAGHRIFKIKKTPGNSKYHYTNYVRDAKGGILSIYEYEYTPNNSPPTISGTPHIYLKEQTLYGTGRIGVIKRNLQVSGPIQILNDGPTPVGMGAVPMSFALKSYMGAVESRANENYKAFGNSDPYIPEHALYLSSLQQIALDNTKTGLYTSTIGSSGNIPRIWRLENNRGYHRYEITNHKGDIRQVISDIKIRVDGINNNGLADYYEADVHATDDAYPFGLSMPTRQFNNSSYRFGYNGKENDLDWGNKLIQDYGFRLYSPATARFLSVDPLDKTYPMLTPYQFASNSPIASIDIDGLEKMPYKQTLDNYYGYGGITIEDAEGVWWHFRTDYDGSFEDVSYTNYGEGWAAYIEKRENIGEDFLFAFIQCVWQTRHTALDAAGMVPVIGEFADGVHAVMYLAEGDLGNATISVVAMIPIAGNGATGAKYTKKVLEGDEAVKFFAKAKKVTPCKLKCFPAGTLIKTEDGHKAIDSLALGDWVWALDEESLNITLKQVIDLIQLERDSLIKIHVSNEIIQATTDHPFFTNNGWMEAEHLVVGDTLFLFDSSFVTIDSIELVNEKHIVYNLTVDGYHTFFVGEQSILVHNCGWSNALLSSTQKQIKNWKSNSRKYLDKQLGGKVGDKLYAHHLIPLQMAFDSKFVQNALEQGFKINEIINGSLLPGSIHSDGGHKKFQKNLLDYLVKNKTKLLKKFGNEKDALEKAIIPMINKEIKRLQKEGGKINDIKFKKLK